MHHRPPERLREFARSMRKDPTRTESELWQRLRGRNLAGLKFRRQVPLGGFILDFVCFEALLIVELDGSQHLGSESDVRRDAAMLARGMMTLRFENDDVEDDIDAVCLKIASVAKGRIGASGK
jgi:very-short-patch-repair endonuclease